MQFIDRKKCIIISSMDTKLPCVLMRGGTSRGPYFLAEWLPADVPQRDRLLLAAMGSPHELQVDGLGGGNTLTSKVAIVSRSTRPDCDVDYLFAQVSPDQALVDTRPNCGNMLAGVGPFAIEQGLVNAQGEETRVRIFNVNTRARVDAVVQTPGGRVTYAGSASIDGVGGTAAPVKLNFLDAWGTVTGSVFPTGKRQEMIDDLAVTLIDAAMPMMMVAASSLGLKGTEMPAELDMNSDMLLRLEMMRREAGFRMGLGDVRDSVTPKPVLLSPGQTTDQIVSRYFTPKQCHKSHAVTGAIGVATAFLTEGTVASRFSAPRLPGTHHVQVFHPSGKIDIDVDLSIGEQGLSITSAALIRTVRKIMEGDLYVPSRA